MLKGLHSHMYNVSSTLVGSLNSFAGECLREYMVNTGSNPVLVRQTAGKSLASVCRRLLSEEPNAGGITSFNMSRSHQHTRRLLCLWLRAGECQAGLQESLRVQLPPLDFEGSVAGTTNDLSVVLSPARVVKEFK